MLFVALAGAWATHALGLSMALGAFLAGMLLAETEFRHQTEAVIKPFQDILLGLFFVFVGMLLDLRLLVTQLPLVLLLLAALLVVKAAIVAAIVRAVRPQHLRKALRTGIAVCMGGEFGFALLTRAVERSAGADGARAAAADGRGAVACWSGRCWCATTGASPTACSAASPRCPPTACSRPRRRARSRSAST